MVTSKLLRRISIPLPGTMHEWLLLSSGFACLLLLVRIVVTGSLAYFFLPWNLMLAFIPYWISSWITKNIGVMESRLKLLLVSLCWLLFIPNSFYIMTDLFHLSRFKGAPEWFDLLMIFSFAWNGIIAGVISLRRVELIISLIKGKELSILVVGAIMWLCALGIYIGRFLRYNSWDILTDPFSLAGDIIHMILHPFQNGYAWGMTLCYGMFMTLVYFMFKKLGDVFYSREIRDDDII
jgi:uncharacterized membrane protein